MAEKKKKTPTQIVVPIPVKIEIEDEARRLTRKENRHITQGEVVTRLWKKYAESKSAGKSDLSDTSATIFLHAPGGKGGITHEITTKEIPWTQKFLRIIRSKTQFKKSIEENVDGFCLGLDALEEVAELRAKLGDSTGSSTDQAGDESGDDLAEGIKRARADADRIGRSLEGTGADGKDVRKKKA